DDYVGKITVDPLLNIPATDQRGWRFDGDFSPKAGSPIIGAGDPSIPGPKDIGATGGPCLEPQSSMCLDFIKNNPPRDPLVPVVVNPPDPINPNPIPGDNTNTDMRRFGMPPLLPQFLPKAKLYSAPVINLYNTQKNDKNKDMGMNLFMFLVVSGIYIMIMHFAVGVRDFNLMLFIVYFGIGGIVGLWFNSWEMGFVASIILSLLFI
ncbi:MAG: hypothetical protein Q7R95_05535, partial [bacterium]|nr:hypothetical protein [bacterium]